MNELQIITIPVTPVEQNCRIICLEKFTLLIDPGGDYDKILKALRQHNLQVQQIWLTHSHFDHCGGVADIKTEFPEAKLLAHPIEKEFRQFVPEIAAQFGLPDAFKRCPEPDIAVLDDCEFDINNTKVKILFTPGHSPGHLCFYFPQHNICVCGDTVFQDSVGRTDLPYASWQQLCSSIKTKLLTLPPETKLLPGHGPNTTVERELKFNPFLK